MLSCGWSITISMLKKPIPEEECLINRGSQESTVSIAIYRVSEAASIYNSGPRLRRGI